MSITRFQTAVAGAAKDRVESRRETRFRNPGAARRSSRVSGDHAAAPQERGPVLHEIFEANADRRPEVIAVTFGCEEVTYAELDRRANRIARHLRARSVRRESRVAMLLPRGPDIYATLLGILKAGAAYVPLD